MLALALDLGGSHATCALVRGAEVLAKRVVRSTEARALAPLLRRFADAFDEMACECGISLRDCAGLALGFCGLVNCDTGRVLSTDEKYEDAPTLDLPRWAREEFGLAFRAENDARMALLGERGAGAARGYDDIVMMTLGTGIGAAAMMHGKLVRGKHYQGGCLGGHLAMNPRGRRCTCGAIGCAESEASTWALPLICESWPAFATSRLAKASALNFEVLFRLAAEGDLVADEIKRHCIDVWAALTVSLIHAYDPEAIVIGGGVMRSGEQVLPAIRKRVEENAWTPWGKVAVKQAECGEDAGLLGAVPLLEEIRG